VTTRCVIRSNGIRIEIAGPVSIAHIEHLIGADICDTVMLADGLLVMIVDDLGHSKESPLNAIAMGLFPEVRPGNPWVIKGDVVVVPDNDFAPVAGSMHSGGFNREIDR
jgi:hypothetical protein